VAGVPVDGWLGLRGHGAAGRAGLFAVRGTDDLLAETKETGHTLKRAIGAFDLTA
jgi:hypothetical protein